MLPVSRKNYFPNFFFLLILSPYQSQILDQTIVVRGKLNHVEFSIDRMKKVEISFPFIVVFFL